MLTKKQMEGIQLIFGIKLINIQLHVVKIKKEILSQKLALY
jgi:hypothetical protein